MERGYLVASLALVITFAGVSRGFRSVEQMSFLRFLHTGSQASSQNPTEELRREAERLRTHLRPRYAEEAQLLAEMNVPVMAEQMAGQQAAQCARQKAMQQAQRAQRDMLRMQRDAQRSTADLHIEPLSLQMDLPPDFNARIQETAAAAAARMAVKTVKLQLAADRMGAAAARLGQIEMPSVVIKMNRHERCNDQDQAR